MTFQFHIGPGYRFPRRTQHGDKYITSLVQSSQRTVDSGGYCTLFFSRWSIFDIKKGKQCDLQRPDCSKSRRSLVKLRLTTKSSRVSASLFIEISHPRMSTTEHGTDKIPLIARVPPVAVRPWPPNARLFCLVEPWLETNKAQPIPYIGTSDPRLLQEKDRTVYQNALAGKEVVLVSRHECLHRADNGMEVEKC